MPNPSKSSQRLLRLFIRFAAVTFFVGGSMWVWADLRQFEPITAFVTMESLVIWCTLGWMPSLGIGGLAVGTHVLLGGHPEARRRYGLILIVGALLLTGVWIRSMEIPVDIKSVRIDTAMYARSIREAGEATESGEVADYIDDYFAPRSRYVALQTLRNRRSELRVGSRWNAADLSAVESAAMESLHSSHKPLRRLALETLGWALMEGLEPGGMAELLSRPEVPAAEMVSWLTDWERPGRPRLEGQLAPEDYAAIQDWASSKLPAGLPALRWALEQGGEGSVAAFLAREHSDAALSDVFRAWCTTEGWSPLLRNGGLTSEGAAALDAALVRLSESEDPILRREAVAHQSWVERVVRVRQD